MSQPFPDLREVRRRAAELIEREGHVQVDECPGPHGGRKRHSANGPRCVPCGVQDTLRDMGYQPSITTADVAIAIAQQLAREVGHDWFPYGDTLYHWNDWNDEADVVAGLKGEA